MEVTKKPLIISVSPHVKSEETTSRIMWSVSAALLPAAIMGSYFFGARAVMTVALCIISAMLSEYIYQKALKKKITVNDGSAFLTGLLLGLNLPPSVPFYIPIIGSFVAIVITKQLFGGLGYNIFNPALIGRAFLLISFPKLMTIWSEPTSAFLLFDAKTTATPLGILKEEGYAKLIEVFGDQMNLYTQLLIGHRAGSIGETSSVALLHWCSISLLQKIHHMAYPSIISWDSSIDCMDIRWQRRSICRRSFTAPPERRHDTRCILYGNRLCYMPFGEKRTDTLRHRLRFSHHAHKA